MIAKQTSGERTPGFWAAGWLAVILALLSWVKPFLVEGLNAHVLHREPTSAAANWIYLLFRLLLVAALVSVVLSFPEQVTDKSGTEIRQGKARWFDPLMGLRALACMLVLIGHYFLVVFPFVSHANPWLVALLRCPPWAGVWVFFTLSGYLMGKGFFSKRYALDEAGVRRFLRNRLLRIVPIYYVATFLLCVWRYPNLLWGRNLWMPLEICSFDFRGNQPVSSVNALWSVSTELQFYLMVPLLMVVLLRVNKALGRAFLLAPVALLCMGTLLRLFIAPHGELRMYSLAYSPVIPNLDLFVAGMSVNMLPKPHAMSHRLRAWLGPFLLAGATTFYCAICFGLKRHYDDGQTLQQLWAWWPLPCGLFAAGFIYIADLRGSVRVGDDLRSRVLLSVQMVGTLTYCLYVFHSDVFLATGALLPSPHPLSVSLKMLPVVALTTLGVASFFYYAVEKPFDLKKKVSGTPLVDAP